MVGQKIGRDWVESTCSPAFFCVFEGLKQEGWWSYERFCVE